MEPDPSLPKGIVWYFTRAADITPVSSRDTLAAYVKLPGMVFYTYVAPPDPGGWRGTMIGRRGTLHNANQRVDDGLFGEFLIDRVRVAFETIPSPTPAQEERFRKLIEKNPERALASRSLKAFIEEKRVRGE